MTREEAIKIIDCYDIGFYDLSGEKIPADKLAEAFYMATEALQTPPISQRSMYQAGYRQGREEALEQVTGKLNNPEDSLLTADPEACKEQKSKLDLISRQDAIETVGDWMVKEFGYLDLNRGERLIDAIEALPSAEAPRPIDPTIEVDLESGVVPISACEPRGPKTIIYADRPRGEWHKNVEYSATGNGRTMADQCSVCSGMVPWGMSDKFNFCPNCGAEMRTTKGEK